MVPMVMPLLVPLPLGHKIGVWPVSGMVMYGFQASPGVVASRMEDLPYILTRPVKAMKYQPQRLTTNTLPPSDLFTVSHQNLYHT